MLFCAVGPVPSRLLAPSSISVPQAPLRHHPYRGQYSMDAAHAAGSSLLDALDPGFHCVRAHWIRGFMAFQLPGAPGP